MARRLVWKFFCILAVVVAPMLSSVFGDAAAQIGGGLEKVTVAIPAISPSMSIMQVTNEAGIFRKHGLDVTIQYIEGGTRTTQALIASEIKIALIAGPDVVNAQLAGSDVVAIASVADRFTDVLVSGKDVKTTADLKGKKLGVSQFGTVSDFASRFALKELKLDPAKDVTILQIGGEQARIGALKAGHIDAGLVDASLTPMMKGLGFNILYSFLDSPLRFQFTCVAASKAYLKQNSETVRKFMRGFVEGIKYYKSNRTQAVNIISTWMRTEDKEGVGRAYDIYAKILEQKPYPSLEGLKAVLDVTAAKEPKAKVANPEQFVDDSFLRDLDRSGFFNSL
jgi:NitT/TauT family transport system substrate-binding protein